MLLQPGGENGLRWDIPVSYTHLDVYKRQDMLKSGTTTKTRKQIADELDRIKTDISFSGGTTSLSININTDKENLPAALSLLDDMLKNPKFDAAEFEKVVLETKAGYEAGKSDPQTIVSEKFGKLVSNYPQGHPYYSSGDVYKRQG